MRKEQERVIGEAMRWYRSHIKEPYGYRADVALFKACAALRHVPREEGVMEEILAMLRREHSVNDFGDVVGAQPEQGWETGYAAGIRCTYRQIKEQRALKPGGKS